MKAQIIAVPSAKIGSPSVHVRVPDDRELDSFDQLLADKYYSGAGRSVGDCLRQVVDRDGEPVAILVWGQRATRSRIGTAGFPGAPINVWNA